MLFGAMGRAPIVERRPLLQRSATSATRATHDSLELPDRAYAFTDAQLKDAVELLAAWKQVGGRLKMSRQARLRALFGCLPTQQQAKLWIPALGELRKEPALRQASG